MIDKNAHKAWVPSTNAAFRRIKDEVVIVDTSSNKMLTLNETASEIWCMLDGRSVREIVDTLVQTFQVDRTAASADVDIFLTDMEKRGLVVPDQNADRKVKL